MQYTNVGSNRLVLEPQEQLVLYEYRHRLENRKVYSSVTFKRMGGFSAWQAITDMADTRGVLLTPCYPV